MFKTESGTTSDSKLFHYTVLVVKAQQWSSCSLLKPQSCPIFKGKFCSRERQWIFGTNCHPWRNVRTQSVWDQSRSLGTHPPTPLRANPYPPAPIQSLNLTYGRKNGLSVQQLIFSKTPRPKKTLPETCATLFLANWPPAKFCRRSSVSQPALALSENSMS